MLKRQVLALGAAVLIVAAAYIAFTELVASHNVETSSSNTITSIIPSNVSSPGSTSSANSGNPHAMLLQDFGLCSSNCNYPSPYLYGEIYFGSVPAKNLELFVNGTDEGNLGHGIEVINAVYTYKGTFQFPKVISGQSYEIKFLAVFTDNSTVSASTVVVAD